MNILNGLFILLTQKPLQVIEPLFDSTDKLNVLLKKNTKSQRTAANIFQLFQELSEWLVVDLNSSKEQLHIVAIAT